MEGTQANQSSNQRTYNLDLFPLDGRDLSKDTQLIIHAANPNQTTVETMHSLQGNQLVIDDLQLPANDFLEFLQCNWLPSENQNFEKIINFPVALDKLMYIQQQIKIIIDNRQNITGLSTRRQLIILADVMAFCFI